MWWPDQLLLLTRWGGSVSDSVVAPRGVDDERRAWAQLAVCTSGYPCGSVRELAQSVGPVAAVEMLREGRLRGGLEAAADVSVAALDEGYLERMVAIAARVGARLVTPVDDEWPAQLVELATCEGCVSVPMGLWVRGRGRLDELAEAAVGVVGSRASTTYGDQVSSVLAAGVAVQGWTTLGGASFGIESAAHRAALAVGGACIAVLPVGIERAYPSAHAGLLEEIERGGVIISEHLPGSVPNRRRLLSGSRVIAALASAVVVVESGKGSGASRAAAEWATRFGRPLGAVPGPVASAQSAGCHGLIASGRARLVTGPEDVSMMVTTHLAEKSEPVTGQEGLQAFTV